MTSDDPITPAAPGAAVFVDNSGQRATRIRRTAAFLVLLCLAYGAALLIAALTGVPIQGAIVPYPALGSSTHSTHSNKSPQHTPTQPGAGSTSSTAFAPAISNTTPSGIAPHATATKSAHGNHSSTPTAASTPSAGATTPTATPTKARGKSSTAPGATNRPTSRPSSTATTHGRSGKA